MFITTSSSLNSHSWPAVAREVQRHLPEDADYNNFECQSNSCKIIQVWQTLFCGSLLGKELNADVLVVGAKVKKKTKPKRGQPKIDDDGDESDLAGAAASKKARPAEKHICMSV